MLARQGGVKRREGAPPAPRSRAPGLGGVRCARCCAARGPQRAARLARRGARAGRRAARRHLRGDGEGAAARASSARAPLFEPMGGALGRRGARRGMARAPLLGELPAGAGVRRRRRSSTRWRSPRAGPSWAPLRRRPRGARPARVRDGALQPRVPRRLLHLLLVRRQRRPGPCASSGGTRRARRPTTAPGGPRSPRRSTRGARSRTITASDARRRRACARSSGAGVEVVRALMRAFDPPGISNPGNLLPPGRPRRARAPRRAPRGHRRAARARSREPARGVDGRDRARRPPSSSLRATGLTLDARRLPAGPLATGSPRARRARATAGSTRPTSSSPASTRRWWEAGRCRSVPPRGAPSAPDLTALFVGARDALRPHRQRLDARARPRHDAAERRGVLRATATPRSPQARARCSTC